MSRAKRRDGPGLSRFAGQLSSRLGKKTAADVLEGKRRLLGVSRYLVPETDRTDNSPPTAEITLRFMSGRSPTVTVSMNATDDRELRATLFYDPQNDMVIGGADLKGKKQTLELKLSLDNNNPAMHSLVRMLETALKPGANPGLVANDSGIRLVTFLADSGGNACRSPRPSECLERDGNARSHHCRGCHWLRQCCIPGRLHRRSGGCHWLRQCCIPGRLHRSSSFAAVRKRLWSPAYLLLRTGELFDEFHDSGLCQSADPTSLAAIRPFASIRNVAGMPSE